MKGYSGGNGLLILALIGFGIVITIVLGVVLGIDEIIKYLNA